MTKLNDMHIIYAFLEEDERTILEQVPDFEKYQDLMTTEVGKKYMSFLIKDLKELSDNAA